MAVWINRGYPYDQGLAADVYDAQDSKAIAVKANSKAGAYKYE